MRKKILTAMAFLMIVFTFTACGDSKYNVADGSQLTEQDMTILQLRYDDLTTNEQIDLTDMPDRMSEEELLKFKNDLKRLYVGKMEKDYGNKESAEKAFEENYDYELREKQGKLTETEKKEEKERKEAAAEFNSKVGEYMVAKDEIQERLNNNLENKHDGYIIESKAVDADSVNEKITIDADIITSNDITVGQMTAIRNEIAQEVDEVIEKCSIEINMKLNEEDKGTYTFTAGDGWDKQIEP